MEVGNICTRPVDTIAPQESVLSAAQRMLQRNVGSLVIVNERSEPIGIVTDRDLTLRVIAANLDAKKTTVADVMSGSPRLARECHTIDAALTLMREVPCRRIPVMANDSDALVGLLSLDDIHEYHAEEAQMMGGILRRENPDHLEA